MGRRGGGNKTQREHRVEGLYLGVRLYRCGEVWRCGGCVGGVGAGGSGEGRLVSQEEAGQRGAQLQRVYRVGRLFLGVRLHRCLGAGAGMGKGGSGYPDPPDQPYNFEGIPASLIPSQATLTSLCCTAFPTRSLPLRRLL